MSKLRERVNFTIDPGVRSRLESRIPRSRRSAFVEAAIDKALEDSAGDDLIRFLENMPTIDVADGSGAVETMRSIRRKMQENTAHSLTALPE